MHITKLAIQGLKSVASLDFVPNRHLNVLTGPNNTGKSTILQALNVLSTFRGHPWPFMESVSQIATDARQNPPAISVNVTITEDDWMGFVGVAIPTDEYTFNFSLLPESRLALDSVYELGIYNGGRRASLWNEDDEIFSDQPFDPVAELSLPLTDPNRRSILDPLRVFLPHLFCFDPHRAISPKVDLSDFGPFDSSGSKLTRHLIHWKLQGDDRWDQYCHFVEGIFPGLGRLVTPQVRGTNEAYLAFRRRGTEIRISEVGSGVQQLLVLAYQCISKEAHVVALEEPEVHLHPSAQRILFNNVRALSEQAQVFVVTHSPLFVDRNAYRNNWLVSLDGAGHTVVAPLKSPDPLRAVRSALGIALGDSLFAGDCILVVEGPTEQFVLPILSEASRSAGKLSIDFNRVAIVSAGGTGNVESVIKVLQGFGVPIGLLVDNDKHSRLVVKRCVNEGLVAKDSVMVVSRPATGGAEVETDAEFEDVLRLDLYLQAMNEKYGVAVSEEFFISKEDQLTKERHGHLPPRTHVCKALLVELGKVEAQEDYDKVGVGVSTVARYGPDDIPPLFSDLASLLSRMLAGVDSTTTSV